jgi:hypothetical protein
MPTSGDATCKGMCRTVFKKVGAHVSTAIVDPAKQAKAADKSQRFRFLNTEPIAAGGSR